MANPYDPPAYQPARPRRGLDARTVPGALRVAAMLLLVVAGVLTFVAAVGALDSRDVRGDAGVDDRALIGIVVLLLGVLLLACAWMAWAGMAPMGGVLAAVTGVILLILYPVTAGILALLGGVLLLASTVAPARAFT